MSLFSPPATSSLFSARCCLAGSSQLSPPSMPSLLIATSLYHHPLKITPRDLLPDTTWAWALELQTPFQEVTHPSFASPARCAPKDSLLCWSTQHSSCSRPPHHNPTMGWFQEVTEIIGSSSYLLGWGGVGELKPRVVWIIWISGLYQSPCLARVTSSYVFLLAT